MLIYLDTGDLANLERLRDRDRGSFEQFLDGWNARQCVLALSLHHAQETADLGTAASRARRLGLIAEFPRIAFERGGSYKLAWLEAAVQITALIHGEAADYGDVLRPQLFLAGLDEFCAVVLESSTEFAKLRQEEEFTAKVRQSTRGRRLPRSYRKQSGDAINRTAPVIAAIEAFSDGTLSPLTRRSMAPVLGAIVNELQTAENVRFGFEKAYGLAGYDVLDRVDDDDLHRVASFFSVAQQVFEDMAGEWQLPPQDIADLLRQLNPSTCPGVRIEMAVSRALDVSQETAVANDEADRAHISFLPYVDLMFVDRRTAGFYRQGIALDKAGVLDRYASRLAKSGPSAAILNAIARVV